MLNLCEGILHKVVLHGWVDVIPYDFNIFVPVCARLFMPKSCREKTQWSQKVYEIAIFKIWFEHFCPCLRVIACAKSCTEIKHNGAKSFGKSPQFYLFIFIHKLTFFLASIFMSRSWNKTLTVLQRAFHKKISIRGHSTTMYLDRILPFPPCVESFYILAWAKQTFLTPSHPHLVHVVIEYPLS